jgi:RNA polymerase-binding transcription factor
MKRQQKAFLEQLGIKRAEFQQALRRLMETHQNYNEIVSGDSNLDESDHAQRELSACCNYSLIQKKSDQLKRIERLIRKISQDQEFGECEECGNPIPPERLLIVPDTVLCVRCQEMIERLDRMNGLTSGGGLSRMDKADLAWDDDSSSVDMVFDSTDDETEGILPPEVDEIGISLVGEEEL